MGSGRRTPRHRRGAVAHLGERFNGIEEAEGSNPSSSTTKNNSMFFLYVLESELNGRFYVGSSKDVSLRLTQHNSGLNSSTRSYRPWRLI